MQTASGIAVLFLMLMISPSAHASCFKKTYLHASNGNVYYGYCCKELSDGNVYCGRRAGQSCSSASDGNIYCGYKCRRASDGNIYCASSWQDSCYEAKNGLVYCNGVLAQPASPAEPASPVQ
jgi:hypothetical protein